MFDWNMHAIIAFLIEPWVWMVIEGWGAIGFVTTQRYLGGICETKFTKNKLMIRNSTEVFNYPKAILNLAHEKKLLCTCSQSNSSVSKIYLLFKYEGNWNWQCSTQLAEFKQNMLCSRYTPINFIMKLFTWKDILLQHYKEVPEILSLWLKKSYWLEIQFQCQWEDGIDYVCAL